VPLIINELEVNVAPDVRQSSAAAPAPPVSPGGLTPQQVLALVDRTRSLAERLRAH
jgi:hypothetical protein